MKEPLFFCDRMLISLGRWLRIAGYDTRIAEEGFSDQECLNLAKLENRYLITRDRHFLAFKETQNLIIYLESNGTEANVKELSSKTPINWQLRPFSRCSLCNTPLLKPSKEQIESLPSKITKNIQEFWLCPKCNQVYWEGSHTKRMLKTLSSWNELKK